ASRLIEVRDSTGAVPPDVAITLTNDENGLGRRGTTSAQGTCSVDRLPTGLYTLTASRNGFKTEVVKNIRVLTAIKAIVPIMLTPGVLSEHVEVTADGTTLRTGNSTVGEVFDSHT